jgi:hypothetical protein
MVDDTPTVTDEATFREHLRRLLHGARDNGVVVEGGWEINGEGGPDLDVVVTVVRRGGD